MRHKSIVVLWILALCVFLQESGRAQKMNLDVKFGFSSFSGNGSSSGVLFGGGLDIPSGKDLSIRPELNITTHSGTPCEIAGIVKYHIPTTGSPAQFYVDGGMGIWFYSGGPYFGLDFGGGAIFPLEGSKFSIPAEIRLGPVFSSGSSTFQIALTSGIRFALP